MIHLLKKSALLVILLLTVRHENAFAQTPFEVSEIDPQTQLDLYILAPDIELASSAFMAQLVRVTGDALDAGTYYDIQAILDVNRKITGMALLKNGVVSSRHELRDILAKNVVLVRTSDRDAILIHSDQFSPASGGSVRMTYLYSGLSNEYRHFDMKVKSTGSKVGTFTANDRPFTRMSLVKNTFFGKTIGIARIDVAP